MRVKNDLKTKGFDILFAFYNIGAIGGSFF